MEQIIRIMAQSVREQVEQVQATAEARPMMESTEQVGARNLARVKSAQARRHIESITGISFKDSSNQGILDSQRIEQNLASRFEILSKAALEDDEHLDIMDRRRSDGVATMTINQNRQATSVYFADAHDGNMTRQRSTINS